MKAPATAELVIERLVKTGEGLSHFEGRAVFVEKAIPPERVRVALSTTGKVLRGRVVEWLSKSPHRRESACALAERCGGCDWLHADEALQRREKEEVVLSALEHLGGIDRRTLRQLPFVSSPKAMGYRRRAVLHPVGDALGFFERQTHSVVPVARCPALTAALQDLPSFIAARWGSALKDVEEVRLLEIDGQVAVHVQLKGAMKPKWAALARALGKEVGVVVAPKTGQPLIEGRVELTEGPLLHRPDAFVQANAEVNATLVSAATNALELGPTAQVLELYCGNGNFTFSLAAQAGRVTAVESSSVSLGLGQKAAQRAGVANIRWVQGDVLKACAGLVKEGVKFDRVLLDPPRTGAAGLAAMLPKLGVERVVYVACDPAALARDAAQLAAQGYAPVTLQLFDLFPQTHHVEAVLSLRRGDELCE